MKDGRMIMWKQNYVTPEEWDLENTIIVEILVGNTPVPGATRHSKSLNGNIAISYYVIKEGEMITMMMMGRKTLETWGSEGIWCLHKLLGEYLRISEQLLQHTTALVRVPFSTNQDRGLLMLKNVVWRGKENKLSTILLSLAFTRIGVAAKNSLPAELIEETKEYLSTRVKRIRNTWKSDMFSKAAD